MAIDYSPKIVHSYVRKDIPSKSSRKDNFRKTGLIDRLHNPLTFGLGAAIVISYFAGAKLPFQCEQLPGVCIAADSPRSFNIFNRNISLLGPHQPVRIEMMSSAGSPESGMVRSLGLCSRELGCIQVSAVYSPGNDRTPNSVLVWNRMALSPESRLLDACTSNGRDVLLQIINSHNGTFFDFGTTCEGNQSFLIQASLGMLNLAGLAFPISFESHEIVPNAPVLRVFPSGFGYLQDMEHTPSAGSYRRAAAAYAMRQMNTHASDATHANQNSAALINDIRVYQDMTSSVSRFKDITSSLFFNVLRLIGFSIFITAIGVKLEQYKSRLDYFMDRKLGDPETERWNASSYDDDLSD